MFIENLKMMSIISQAPLKTHICTFPNTDGSEKINKMRK